MPVIPLGYPLDLTATAATNFIQNEVVTFNTVQEKMFVPSKGPFYTLSMEIRHGVTNALLQPETQYKLLQPVKEAIRMSGKEVCAVIYITDNSIPSITISYRVIGGIFSDTASEISDVLLNNPLPPSSQVSWWDILDKPDQFTPSEHLHHVDNIYGMDDVVAVLENIRIAILAGDSVAIGAIYQYINVLLSNLEYATENYVDDTFAQLDSTPYVRTFKTYNDLRAFSDLVNNESYIYLATGKNAVNDRKGKVFMWDITCTIADDNEDIIRPNHIPVGNPGRFVSVLIIESKFKLLAASLGRAFDTEGNLLSSFNSTGRIFEGDLNTLVEQGPWLFTAASTNKPTRMTSLSSNPMAIGEGYINVTKLDGKVIQEVLMAGLDVSPNSEFIAQSFKRAGLETTPGSSTYTWSRWDATASQNTLARFGIDRAIAAENSLSSIADLDLLVVPGKYWFGDSQDNRPFDWGVLEIELVGGSIVAPGEVYQYAYWDGRKASRSRNYLGVWSRWSFSQNLDIATEANIAGQDLDNVIAPDLYYYNTTCANTPSNYGILEVRRENGYIIYQIAHSSDNRLFSRYRSSGGTWTVWREYADALTLSKFITDTNAALGALAASVQRVLNTTTEEYEDSLLINQAVVVGDCNNYIKEGKFWISTGIANSPFPNCVMEVTNIAALNAGPSQGEVLQVFDDGLGKRARRIRQYVSPGVYQWSDLIIKDDAAVEEKIECNIGVVIRYFGQTPVLMPCYIGEDPGIYYVTVKISGEVKTLQLDNIAPVPDLVNGSHNLAYIYLVENPPGTFALARGAKPNFPSTGNMTQERKSMYHPGDNPLTSNRLFVGLAYSDGIRYRLCRSWFQDPGFIENYYNSYMDPTLLDNPAALSVGVSGNTLPVRFYEPLIGYLGIFMAPGNFYLEANQGVGAVRDIPFISWAGESVSVSFMFNARVINPESAYAIYLNAILAVITNDGTGYYGSFGNHRVQNGGYSAPGDETNTYDTISSSFTAANKADTVGSFKIGAVGSGGATLRLLPGFGYNAVITLSQVHNFRKLYINASNPAIWFPNLRQIVLTGTVLDLDLKAYHDNLYGGPAPAGTTVEFIVSPGCLVCSSSTSTYALTNPNTWASGVVIKLIVKSGGYVSGRGGDGGRGGRAYRLATDPANYYNYIGGYASSPTSHVHGKKGGNAIRTFRALIIELSGYIGVGGGGGGASAGGIIFFNTAANISKIASGGNSGGGGWPFGLAGRQSQITPLDDSFADYYLDTLDGYEAWHVAGNIGQSSGGISEITTLKSGGLPTTRVQGGVNGATITHNAGGNGSLPFLSQFSTGGGGSSWTNVVSAQIGDAGNGGADGDYAINGIANVTLINNGGIIRGGQV